MWREGGLRRGENFSFRLTTASAQCLVSSERFFLFPRRVTVTPAVALNTLNAELKVCLLPVTCTVLSGNLRTVTRGNGINFRAHCGG